MKASTGEVHIWTGFILSACFIWSLAFRVVSVRDNQLHSAFQTKNKVVLALRRVRCAAAASTKVNRTNTGSTCVGKERLKH